MEFSELPKRGLLGDSPAAKAARRFGVSVMCVTLLITAAFGSGVYWDRLHAQGTPAHARMLVPDADEKIGRQAMHRLWEDMQASADLYESYADGAGWRGTHARNYLEMARKRFVK